MGGVGIFRVVLASHRSVGHLLPRHDQDAVPQDAPTMHTVSPRRVREKSNNDEKRPKLLHSENPVQMAFLRNEARSGHPPWSWETKK